MKHFKTIAILLLSVLAFSCNKEVKSKEKEAVVYHCPMQCEGDKTYDESGSCPVCNMDVKSVETKMEHASHGEVSETSIFNLTSKWNTEEGDVIELKDLRGKTLVMVMIYTTCKAACPRFSANGRGGGGISTEPTGSL